MNRDTLTAIYCDDFPESGRGGFSSILENIFFSKLKPDGLTLQSISTKKVCNIFPSNTIFYWPFIGNRGASKLIWQRAPLLVADFFIAIFCSLKKNNVPQVSSICVFVGADWTSILRGIYVATLLGANKKTVYVVDNIYEFSQSKSGIYKLFIENLISRLFNSFDSHLAITKCLVENLNLKTKQEWTVTPLPYDFSVVIGGAKPTNEQRQTISLSVDRHKLIFLGALSYYVTPMLDRLIEMMSDAPDLRRGFEVHIVSQKISGEFCIKHREALKSGWLKTFIGLSDADIQDRYKSSGIFICPYSDFSEHASFVSQSFPSKYLKMLYLGIPSVILAPPYAAICRTYVSIIPTVHLKHKLEPLLDLIELLRYSDFNFSDEIKRTHDVKLFFKKAL